MSPRACMPLVGGGYAGVLAKEELALDSSAESSCCRRSCISLEKSARGREFDVVATALIKYRIFKSHPWCSFPDLLQIYLEFPLSVTAS